MGTILTMVILFFGYLLSFARHENRGNSWNKENQGETEVRYELNTFTASSDYYLLNNVTLPIADGTTQIDHILISRFGIFVIESKHYKGWIFADRNIPQWTQTLYKKRFKFQNPIFQNHKHMTAVAKLLDFLPAENIHSMVVFTGNAVFKTLQPEGVFLLREMNAHIANFSDTVITENRMQFCVGRLECCRKPPTQQTEIDHIAYLHRRFGNAL